MADIEIIVRKEDSGRIDAYLAEKLDELSRSYIKKLIKKGNVLINDEKIKPRYNINEGDKVEINLPKPKEIEAVPEDIPISIVYEDDDIAVVNKPQGMVVHPAKGNQTGTLVNALLYHLDSLSSINGVIRPGIVHRIDKDTTGLLMVAKSDLAHMKLSEQLKEHTITRRYYTLVEGRINEEKGTINAPIGRNPSNRIKMAVTSKNSKEAITHFKVLKRFNKYTLLEVSLETGRTHQIRVHMAYIKHPVVGDPVYGIKRQKFNLTGQLLHAKIIGFKHPRTDKYLEFDSNLPTHFEKILEILEKRKI
ncbi:MAG: RluA family pseudouridine synthase [Firmicutes bacterium]|nr:RluA family pseudouridine synthase [Bacillota bacterium]